MCVYRGGTLLAVLFYMKTMKNNYAVKQKKQKQNPESTVRSILSGFLLNLQRSCIFFHNMRLVGLEPTRCHQRQILSLMRLPVPPQPQNQLLDYNNIPLREMQAVFSIF